MKLEVWTELEPRQEEPVRIRLRNKHDALLVLEVVDAGGRRLHNGELGCISADGLHRNHGLNLSLGFRLDVNGAIADV